jgi:ECF transporter S component (folate family)
MVPGMLAGIMFGPVYGFMTGAVTDFVKFVITTSAFGGYNPVFAISFGLMCMIPVLMLRIFKKQTYPYLLFSVAIAHIVGSVIINNLMIAIMYGSGVATMATLTRIIAQVILIPCNTTLLFVLLKSKAFVQAVYDRIVLLCDILGLKTQKEDELLDADIEKLIADRQNARKNKDFAKADQIRNLLLEKGIILEDTREGVRWKRS